MKIMYVFFIRFHFQIDLAIFGDFFPSQKVYEVYNIKIIWKLRNDIWAKIEFFIIFGDGIHI